MKKRLFKILAPTLAASAAVLTPAMTLTACKSDTTHFANIENDEADGFTLSVDKAKEGEDFVATITSTKYKLVDASQILSEGEAKIKQVWIGHEETSNYEFEIVSDYEATIKIASAEIIGDIYVEFETFDTPITREFNVYSGNDEIYIANTKATEGSLYDSIITCDSCINYFVISKVKVNNTELTFDEDWSFWVDDYGDWHLTINGDVITNDIYVSFIVLEQDAEGYTVRNNHLYGINKHGEEFLLTYEQLEELEGGFVVELADGTYRYDAPYDGEGNRRTIKSYMQRAADVKSRQYQIYLVGGEYQLESFDTTYRDSQFYISGILGLMDEPLASLNCLNGTDGPSARLQNIYLDDFYLISFDSLTMIGSAYVSTGSDWGIYGPTAANFSYCYFWGKHRINAFNSQFINCVFDSSEIEELRGGVDKTDYSMFLVDNLYAGFEHCTFMSRGKAVKIYETNDTALLDKEFVFNDCQFLVYDMIQHQCKNAIEVQTNYKTALTEYGEVNPLTVYWNGVYGNITEANADKIWLPTADKDAIEETEGWVNHFYVCGGYDLSDPTEETTQEMVDFHPNELPDTTTV